MRVAVIGNCHASVIAKAVRSVFRDVVSFDCRHITSYEKGDPLDRAFIDEADRVLIQVTDFKKGEGWTDTRSAGSGRVGLFPLIACNFLYPHAGRAHPLANGSRSICCPSGYYEGQISDTVLIDLMETYRGETVDAIVERYLAVDCASLIDLDRLYEINRFKMQRIGAACDFDLWPKIESGFRYGPMFWTYLHPNGVLMRDLCKHALRQLGFGLSRETLQSAVADIKEPFGFAHMPIHPSIVRHFGIEWADEDFLYQFMPDGGFTVREFAARFVRFDHNDELNLAIFNLHNGIDVDSAVATLERERQQRPDAGGIVANLAIGYWKQGRLQNSMEAAVSAVEIDPTQHEWASFLCVVARLSGLPPPVRPV